MNPVKKGEFFEHDNRDGDEGTLPEQNKPEEKQTNKKEPKSQKSKEKGADDVVNSGNKADKWTHDLYEQSQDDKNPKTEQQAKKKSQNRNKTDKPSNSDNNKKGQAKNKDPFPKKQQDKPKQTTKKEQTDKKQEPTAANKSKGLSLSEYLDQGGDSKQNNNKKPNQTKKQTNKANEAKQKPDMSKRLDFSTRKPISTDNFIENNQNKLNKSDISAGMLNLKITTNLDSSKRVVTEGAKQTRSYFTDEDINSYPHAATYRHPNNRSTKTNTTNLFMNEHDVPARSGGMKKSHTSHLINATSGGGASKGKDNYDEYYFNEYDVESGNDYAQQHNQHARMQQRFNRRPFKG